MVNRPAFLLSKMVFIFSCFFSLPSVLFCEEFPIPANTAPVVDQAGLLSPGTLQSINGILHSLYDSGGSQIGVLTLQSLGGSSIEDISIKVTDQWKLGRKGKDDGVLLLIVPSERKLRIEVGRGREGELTDAYARRIIAEVITPSFKNKDYDRGVLDGVAAIISVTDPDFDLSKVGSSQVRLRRRQAQTEEDRSVPVNILRAVLIFLFFGFFVFIQILRMLGLGGGSRGRWGGGGYGGGGWGGGSSGSGWGGGGGGFGGGGSSGQW